LAVPVELFGHNMFGEPFRELTHSLSVNAHGEMLAVAARLQKGQTILVLNRKTRAEQSFRVVHVGQFQDGKVKAGIELLHPPVNFWGIYFPPSRRNDPHVLAL
jgi:hypothetical protein